MKLNTKAITLYGGDISYGYRLVWDGETSSEDVKTAVKAIVEASHGEVNTEVTTHLSLFAVFSPHTCLSHRRSLAVRVCGGSQRPYSYTEHAQQPLHPQHHQQ